MDDNRTIGERPNLFIVSNRASNFEATPSAHRRFLSKKPPLPNELDTSRVRSSNMFTSCSYDSTICESPDKDIILSGIFNYENQTVDVQITDNLIKWKTVKKKQLMNIIFFDKLYSIEPLVNKTNLKKSLKFDQNNFYVEGFTLYMFEKIKQNFYKSTMLKFEHPHHDTNMKWIDEISKRIPSKIFNFFISIFNIKLIILL